MAEFSEYMEKCIIDLMRNTAFTEVLAYVALFTAATGTLESDSPDSECAWANDYARELAGKEGGDPRVVLAAALLLGIGPAQPEPESAAPPQGASQARQILRQIGADEETVGRVCEIVQSHQAGREADSIEFRIVQDADTLARLAEGLLRGNSGKPDSTVAEQLRTPAAKERARTLLQA